MRRLVFGMVLYGGAPPPQDTDGIVTWLCTPMCASGPLTCSMATACHGIIVYGGCLCQTNAGASFRNGALAQCDFVACTVLEV